MKELDHISAILHVLAACFVIIVGSAIMTSCAKERPIDLEPFKKLASNADCAETTNRLFLIDDKLVLWDRRGNCPDNSFAQVLFGTTPQQELCSRRDSIAGPQQSCQDAQYQGMFATIVNNLDKADLGLGAGHQVQPVLF